MSIEYIPRRLVAEHLEQGYRLIPAHEYHPGEYAILMAKPRAPEPLTAAQIRTLAARFTPKPMNRSNKSQAASSSNIARHEREFSRRLVNA